MVETSIPVKYTYKELVQLYNKHFISFKTLMLYKNCPNKIPIKTWKPIEITDSSTKY